MTTDHKWRVVVYDDPTLWSSSGSTWECAYCGLFVDGTSKIRKDGTPLGKVRYIVTAPSNNQELGRGREWLDSECPAYWFERVPLLSRLGPYIIIAFFPMPIFPFGVGIMLQFFGAPVWLAWQTAFPALVVAGFGALLVSARLAHHIERRWDILFSGVLDQDKPGRLKIPRKDGPECLKATNRRKYYKADKALRRLQRLREESRRLTGGS